VEQNPKWLELAKHGIDFIRKYGFDDDGRMYFSVTQDGKPLRKRRYIFSESFTVAAFAAYAKASGDIQAKKDALAVFQLMQRYLSEPGLLPPKLIPETRSMKGLAVPMIMIVTAQILREVLDDPQELNQVIDDSISEIERDFMKPDFKAVLESVAPNGDFSDHFDGRMLCPGHAIEAAWFILKESVYRNHDSRLRQLGLTILDWMLEWGWDQEYGGILYYRDVKGLPVTEYWQDMKFWWPHNEAIIATLLAYTLTHDEKYALWHKRVHDWSYEHFPDPEHGEWFGYLHRDGRVSVTLKGNLWKGPFHLPRMQLECWKLLESFL
jgi:N-acylglucosamine 2-epimerase